MNFEMVRTPPWGSLIIVAYVILEYSDHDSDYNCCKRCRSKLQVDFDDHVYNIIYYCRLIDSSLGP